MRCSKTNLKVPETDFQGAPHSVSLNCTIRKVPKTEFEGAQNEFQGASHAVSLNCIIRKVPKTGFQGAPNSVSLNFTFIRCSNFETGFQGAQNEFQGAPNSVSLKCTIRKVPKTGFQGAPNSVSLNCTICKMPKSGFQGAQNELQNAPNSVSLDRKCDPSLLQVSQMRSQLSELRPQLPANAISRLWNARSNLCKSICPHSRIPKSDRVPACNALSEHYPTTGLKIPLTVFVLDRSRRCFDDPAHPPHPPKSMLSREGAAGSQRHSG